MKTAASALAIILGSFTVFGQGTALFQNDLNSLVYTNGLNFGGAITRGVMAQPNRYYFGLFAAPVGATDPSLFTFLGYATNTAQPGIYSSGNDGVVVPGWAAGENYAMQVRGWSANLGHDWALIAAQKRSGIWGAFGYYGESPISVVYNPGGPPLPPINPLVSGFDLMAIPEPGPMVLFGLFLTLHWSCRHGRPASLS